MNRRSFLKKVAAALPFVGVAVAAASKPQIVHVNYPSGVRKRTGLSREYFSREYQQAVESLKENIAEITMRQG